MSEFRSRTKSSVGLIHLFELGEREVKPSEMVVDFSYQIFVLTHQGANFLDMSVLLLDFVRLHHMSSAAGGIRKVNSMTMGSLEVLDEILSGEVAGMLALPAFRQMLEG